MALGLTHVLVQQFRALDVEEERATLFQTFACRNLLGQRVRHSFGDQRLAAAWRAVQQDALGRTQFMFTEQVGVQERQLHRVTDHLDLIAQTADVLVVDVRYFLQDKFFHFGLGNPFQGESGPNIDQQRVPGTKTLRAKRFGEVHHLLLIGVRDHQRPLTALEDLLEHHNVAASLESGHVDDVHRLVEQDLLAGHERGHINGGGGHHAHLAPAGQDVDRAVVKGLQKDPVGAWRFGEFVDLRLEGEDLGTGLSQGGCQPFVVDPLLGQLAAHVLKFVVQRVVGHRDSPPRHSRPRTRPYTGSAGFPPLASCAARGPS